MEEKKQKLGDEVLITNPQENTDKSDVFYDGMVPILHSIRRS